MRCRYPTNHKQRSQTRERFQRKVIENTGSRNSKTIKINISRKEHVHLSSYQHNSSCQQGTGKRKDIHLINPPKLITSSQQSRQMSFHILDIIQFRGKGIIDVNSNQFPIRFSFIEKGHGSENLDLFDLAWVADFFADFADVDGIVVAFCFGFGVG